MAEIYQFTNK